MAAVAAAQKNREMFAIKKSYSVEVIRLLFNLNLILKEKKNQIALNEYISDCFD